MKGNDIRDRLRELGRKPNKRYGQHFLVDRSVLNKIIESAEIAEGDRVLEIGPGMGVLTEALIDAGAAVTAIEKDRTLAQDLAERLGARAKIVEGDAIELDWTQAMGGPQPSALRPPPYKLVANIPYSITSPILKKTLWSKQVPDVAVLLIQKEVAERIVNSRSLLSLMVLLVSRQAKIVRKVPRKCFYPAPDVESAVIRIIPMTSEERVARWGIDPSVILSLASRAFASPRKKITSTLVSAGHGRDQIAAALVSAGAVEGARPEELSVEQWVRFVSALGKS